MKTKKKTEKNIMVQLREIRDKISIEIQDMNHEELQKYFKSKKSIFQQNLLLFITTIENFLQHF